MTLSAIIPTLDAAQHLSQTIAAVSSADEVLVVDGGSSDDTVEIARRCGARAIVTQAGRGTQMMTGAQSAAGPWLLFLHADTALESGWRAEVDRFMADSSHTDAAATFRFALDDNSAPAQFIEKWVDWRVRYFGLAYGDQGLLIHQDFYRSLGGFRALPLMEDVDFVRRIGRRRLVQLRSRARTSAVRWQRDGWLRRSATNGVCLGLYFLGVPPDLIKRIYG